MIKYRIQFGGIPLTISLDVDDLEAIAPLEATAEMPGTDAIAPMILEDLAQARGAYGHLVGRATTAKDLAAALGQFSQWQPQLLQGAEILEHSWKLDLPEGAIH